MSAQQVLFDAPGPKAVARYRILAAAGIALLIGILGFIGFRMYEKGQLTAEKWSPFIDPNTWTNYYIPGFLDTIQAAAIAIVMSMIFGLMLAMGRMSDIKPVKWIFTAWVEFFRAVPVLIMMIFTFYYLSNSDWSPDNWNPFIGVIAGLVLYNSAVIGEIIRNGVQSLPNGQREAGLAVGLSPSKTRRLILVPQALTSMLPTLVSQVIVVLKDTALGYIILYPELLTRARQLGSAEANVLPAYIVAAVLFIIINYGLSRLAEYVENRQRAKNEGAAKKPDAKEEGNMAGSAINMDPTNQ